MYFRNVLCTVALATLASAAVAKQIPASYDDDDVYEEELDDVFERDAEAEPARTAAWEEAHSGPAPSYHFGDEEEDAGAWHVARDAEAEPSWQSGQPPAWLASLRSKAHKATDAIKSAVPTATHLTKPHTKQSGGLKKHHGSHKMDTHTKSAHARDVDEEEDSDGYPDLSDEEIDGIMARDVGDIPDFGELDVDTSLEGLEGAPLHARGVDEEEDFETPAESEQDLSGYDSEILARRNADGTDNEADYTREELDAFYNSWESAHNDHPHEARDLSDEKTQSMTSISTAKSTALSPRASAPPSATSTTTTSTKSNSTLISTRVKKSPTMRSPSTMKKTSRVACRLVLLMAMGSLTSATWKSIPHLKACTALLSTLAARMRRSLRVIVTLMLRPMMRTLTRRSLRSWWRPCLGKL
jgi:hypothetical protein